MTELQGRSGAAASRGLDVAIATGVCLIAYSYLGALWLNRHGSTPGPLLFVREWVNRPLGIGEDFGVFGIGMLLISSGYLVAAAGTVSVTSLLKTAATRAAIPIAIGVTASATVTLAGGLPYTDLTEDELTFTGYLSDLVLIGPLTQSASLLGLGWVCTVGAIFLVLQLVTLPAARRAPWFAPALQLLVLTAITLTAAATGGWYHDLGLLTPFVTMPVLGQLVWLVRDGAMSAWASAPLVVGCLALLISAERLYNELAGWLYPLTTVYAATAVLLALAGGQRLAYTVPVSWLASRVLPLFLMLGVTGYATLNALHLRVPLSVAFLAALVVTGVTAEGCHQLTRASERLLVRSPREVQR